MRQSLFGYLRNPYIYTFESSFFGSKRGNEIKDFSIQDFKNLGISLCRALYKIISKDLKVNTQGNNLISTEK